MKKQKLILFFSWLFTVLIVHAQQDTTLIPDPNFEKALIDQDIDITGLDVGIYNGSITVLVLFQEVC